MNKQDLVNVAYLGQTSDPVADADRYDAYQDSITARVEAERQELIASDNDLHEALKQMWWDNPRTYEALYKAFRNDDHNELGRIVAAKLDEQITLGAKITLGID